MMHVRDATLDDASAIAAIHAASWRAFYRGSLPDRYLDGDVLTDRQQVWVSRLSVPHGDQKVVVALIDSQPCGFVCAYRSHDARWGTLVDNLHVAAHWHRRGFGARLLSAVREWVTHDGAFAGMYLWVLQNNQRALSFYEAQGGRVVGDDLWIPPGDADIQVPRYRVAWAAHAVQ
jgi:ribosomal protein S18 acetylase RimI-like enzyme